MKVKIFLYLVSFFGVIAQTVTAQKTIQQKSVWPALTQQNKPWTRWWWMGNAVDEENLAFALKQYQQAGLGGVEITPIYGAVGFENQYLQFLSPKWMEALYFTTNTAKTLGLGVDMNTGTGWPFGGPQVKPENAASKIIIQEYTLNAGERINESIVVKEKKQNNAVLQALRAYPTDGQSINLLNKLSSNAILNWSPEKGTWRIYAAFLGKTNQMVKRAAPGGEGFTLDHLDKKSVDVYLERFSKAFNQKPSGVRAFFNDSYEVYGATFSRTFFDVFKQNRGYDLSEHLNNLAGKDSTSQNVARLKSDYRQTMDEMLLENFTKNWTNWAHGLKSITKNQSHGSPGNLLDLYGAVDIPETETFGSSYFPIPGLRRDSADIRNVDPDPMMCKFASSAAHTGGKTLVSAESFTWLTEHFKTSFSQAKPEADQLFLAGINHIFYHGTAYSPKSVAWPGWLFYASIEMNPNNSLWPHVTGLNQYIAHCQSILQAGKADNELLLYWPIFDVWNQAKGLDMPLKVHDVDEWLHPSAFYQLAKQLNKNGYAFDFISDRQLLKSSCFGGKLETDAKANPYRVLIIPACKMMPPETLLQIVTLAKAGATVIFQALPQDVPGLSNLENRRAKLKALIDSLKFTTHGAGEKLCLFGKGKIYLSPSVKPALVQNQLPGESLAVSGLQFIRRKNGTNTYYFLVNHTAKNIDTFLNLNQKGKFSLLNPLNGTTGKALVKDGKVRVQLKSGASLFVKVAAQDEGDKPWVYTNQLEKAITLTKPWHLHFVAGGPELPADQTLQKLVSWTNLNDPKLENFSGTAVYTTTFNLSKKSAREYILKLSQVSESAKVWINEKEVGIMWSLPFETLIGRYLKPGLNTLKIEVANLMANRIRYMDINKMQWRNYHEINFVDINYKPFDASKWKPMPSGLIGQVVIIPVKN